MNDPEKSSLSVVLAVDGKPRSLEKCLVAIDKQRDKSVQVVAVAVPAPDREVQKRFPWVEWMVLDEEALVPILWAQGIRMACNEIVVTTTARFVPEVSWLDNIRKAHSEGGAAGVGGCVDPPLDTDTRTWATYFLRYSNLQLLRSGPVAEIAADNASYRRDDLVAWGKHLGDGFWEPDFHRHLARQGGHLIFRKDIRVRLAESSGAARFCVQRFHHGRQFGKSRAAAGGLRRRAYRIVTAPLIPVVILTKLLLRVLRGGRYGLRFLQALPLLLLFVMSWSAGEMVGYLSLAEVNSGGLEGT